MVANFSHFSIISFKKRQLGGICCPPMGMSVFLETALQCAKKKSWGVKEILAMKCLSLCYVFSRLIFYFNFRTH